MSDHFCGVCDRVPIHHDRFVCPGCLTAAGAALLSTAYLAGHLDSLRARETGVRYDGEVVTGGKGGALPFNPRVTEAHDAVKANLVGTAMLCRDEGPGLGEPRSDNLRDVALALMPYLPWLSTRDFGPDEVRMMLDGRRQIEALWPVPDDRVFLGLCRADLEDGGVCPAALKARPPANVGTVKCRDCGAEHDIAERRAELAATLDDAHLTMRELVALYEGRRSERTFRRIVASGLLVRSGVRPVMTSKGQRKADVYRVHDVEEAFAAHDEQVEKRRPKQRRHETAPRRVA